MVVFFTLPCVTGMLRRIIAFKNTITLKTKVVWSKNTKTECLGCIDVSVGYETSLWSGFFKTSLRICLLGSGHKYWDTGGRRGFRGHEIFSATPGGYETLFNVKRGHEIFFCIFQHWGSRNFHSYYFPVRGHEKFPSLKFSISTFNVKKHHFMMTYYSVNLNSARL